MNASTNQPSDSELSQSTLFETPQDHEARSVGEFVEKMNLAPLYARIAAGEGRPGREPIDPKILTALWLYATIDGVGSARKLDLLCTITPTAGRRRLFDAGGHRNPGDLRTRHYGLRAGQGRRKEA